jgi:signal transduction histidine kinase
MENGKFAVLVVDDSPTMLKKISSIIKENTDAVVYDALSSKDAIRLLGNHQIDIVLMDIFMPEIDGFKTAKLMKQQELTSSIPIIFMTGADPKKELMNAGLELGAIDYLTKPFKDQELIRLLQLYFRFIDREREINKSLTDKNKQLSTEIIERKKAESQLLDKEKKLQESNATKDKFFSIIAHDLKNPLGAFRQLTKILSDSFEDLSLKEIISFINEMNESSKNLYNLLENLLFWARTQTGQIPFQIQDLQISNLIKDVIEIHQPIAKNKKIKIEAHLQDGLTIPGDYNMIHTVMRNLISNALKFTPELGTVCVSNTIEGGKNIISVKDSGIGMSQEQIDNIFVFDKQFTRLGTNEERGTGLGLILCKEFIEKHNGILKIESIINGGSTFKVIF